MGAFLERNMGVMPWKKTGMSCMIRKRKSQQSGVSSQILMIRDTEKVIFNREKCPVFLRSKGKNKCPRIPVVLGILRRLIF